MIKKKRYYRERYSIVWIHHDYGRGKKHVADTRELAAALGKLPDDTPGVLILMGAGKGAYADAYLLGPTSDAKSGDDVKDASNPNDASDKSDASDVASLRELLNATGGRWLRLEPAAVRRVGTGEAQRPAWFSAFARGLGDKRAFHTFAPRADGIQSFDGITGARW